MSRITTRQLQTWAQDDRKIVMVTCYDATFARLVERDEVGGEVEVGVQVGEQDLRLLGPRGELHQRWLVLMLMLMLFRMLMFLVVMSRFSLLLFRKLSLLRSL